MLNSQADDQLAEMKRVHLYRAKVQNTQTNVVKEKGKILESLLSEERI
jgi:hypothetical protein